MNNEFKKILAEIGRRKDYFQGAGGNVSLKSGGAMHVKSSGIRVSDMADKDGFVSLDFAKVRDFFRTDKKTPLSEDASMDAIKSAITSSNGKRPSIETGFHAMLGMAVLHTHSVYANLIACSEEFELLLKSLFDSGEITATKIDYAKPGYQLSKLIQENLSSETDNDILPSTQAIFLKNHGIIISSDTLEETLRAHDRIEDIIKGHFGLADEFPAPTVNTGPNGTLVSGTDFLQNFIRSNADLIQNIGSFVLFPDLIVYCKEISTSQNADSKISISLETGRIAYKCGRKEAEYIEENLLAWAFILDTMKKLRLTPVYISERDAEIIQGMESEKYRISLVSDR